MNDISCCTVGPNEGMKKNCTNEGVKHLLSMAISLLIVSAGVKFNCKNKSTLTSLSCDHVGPKNVNNDVTCGAK